MALAQADEALGLGFRRDVPAHAGGVNAQRARLAAEQRADALALELAAQVPKRGVEPGQRAPDVGAWELVLPVRNQVDQGLGVEGAPAERMGGDLTVDDERREVGVVGRDLAPALGAGVGPDAQEPEVPGAEGLDARDAHADPVSAAPGDAAPLRR